MGKGDRRSRGARAAWRAAVDRSPLPALVVRGKPRQDLSMYNDVQDDPQKTALQARCRHRGADPTDEAMKAAKSPLLGSDVGRCIVALHPPDEQARLWSAFCGMCAAYERHAVLVLGVTYWPKVPQMELTPEPAEVDPDLRIDDRSPEERVRDAKEARRRWDGYLARLPGAYASALAHARLESSPTLWRDAAPTDYGRVTVAALVALADAVEKK